MLGTPLESDRGSITSIVIPNGVTHIQSQAFSGMDNLKRVTLPNSVEFIGHSAFSRNPNLTSINLPLNPNLIIVSIFPGAFTDLPELTNLTIPDKFTVRFRDLNGSILRRPDYSHPFIFDQSFIASAKLPLRTREALRSIGFTRIP